jgi:hypothetical protein
MDFNHCVADALGRFNAFELREVLIVKAHPLENRNQVGLVVTTDGKVNVVSESLPTCKPAHRQSTDEPWANAELAAQFQELFQRLLEFGVNFHAHSIHQNAQTRNMHLNGDLARLPRCRQKRVCSAVSKRHSIYDEYSLIGPPLRVYEHYRLDSAGIPEVVREFASG